MGTEIEEIKIENEIVIKEIAEKLAFNYFNSAFKIGDEYPNGYKGNDRIEEARVQALKVEKENKEKKVFVTNDCLQTLTNKNWCRNIFIIGAGASHDAYDDIPLGAEAISKLLRKLGLFKWYEDDYKFKKKWYFIGFFEEQNENDDSKDYYNHTIGERALKKKKQAASPSFHTECFKNNGFFDKRQPHKAFQEGNVKHEFLKNIITEINHQLEKHYSFGTEPDFEVTLALLSKFFGVNKITSILHSFYSYKYRPSFFYEMVAHLFKHRFIDVIVNFNFDELLDQAIEDELGNGNFHYIISDGDCQNLTQSLFVEKRLRVPIYIKPHGTISHQNLMKFTKEQYIDQSSEMLKLLEQIFEGKIQHEKAHKLNNINIFTAGYAFASAELNQILTKVYSEEGKKVNIYSFDKYNENKEKNNTQTTDKIKTEAYKSKIQENTNAENVKLVKVIPNEDQHGNLDVLIEKVYSVIGKIIKKQFTPQITRHELIKYIWNYRYLSDKKNKLSSTILNYFGNQSESSRQENGNVLFANYLEDRLSFEILLYLAKNNNRIDVKEALQERLGRYYIAYRNEKNKNAKSLREIVDKEVGCKLEEPSDIIGRCEKEKTENLLLTYSQSAFYSEKEENSFEKLINILKNKYLH